MNNSLPEHGSCESIAEEFAAWVEWLQTIESDDGQTFAFADWDSPVPCPSSTVPLVDQGAASANQTGGLLSSAISSVQPFSHWSSPHPHRPQR